MLIGANGQEGIGCNSRAVPATVNRDESFINHCPGGKGNE